MEEHWIKCIKCGLVDTVDYFLGYIPSISSIPIERNNSDL